MVLAIAMTVALTWVLPTPARPACNLDFLRDQAQRSVPDYRVDRVEAETGVVTLTFKATERPAAFAIALHAAGRALSTSAMAIGIDDDALDRATTPLTKWWEQPALQQAVAACCAADPHAPAAPDLQAAVQRALRGIVVDDRRSTRVEPVRAALTLGSAWLIAAVFAALSIARIAPNRRTRVQIVALIACSLLASWVLSVGGPGDLRLNLASIWSGAELELRWGPAPVALFRLLGLTLGGIHDTHIVWTNLLLSSTLPVLLYGIIVGLGVTPAAALLAGWCVAAHPFFIAFAGDLGRQPTYLFAALTGVLAVIRYLGHGGGFAFAVFVLATILATTSRPEGGHVLVVHAVIAALLPANLRRRRVVGVALLMLALCSLGYVRYVLEYGTALARQTSSGFHSPGALLWTVAFDPAFTPLAWIFIWTAGLALAWRRRAAWIGIGCVAGLHIAWTMTGMYHMFVGFERQVASARYQSILLLPFAIGVGLFVETVLAARTWMKTAAVAVVLAATAITFPPAYETLLATFTVDYEYQFLKRQTLTLPPRSRLYVLQAPVDDIGFIDAVLVGSFLPSAVTFETWDPVRCSAAASTGDVPNTFLYIGSSCAELVDDGGRDLGLRYVGWMHDCAAFRRRLAGQQVELIDVPARAMSWHAFKEPTVPLAVYRVTCHPARL